MKPTSIYPIVGREISDKPISWSTSKKDVQ